MNELLIASIGLIGIAVMLLAIGVSKLYKAQAAEYAALRSELRAMRQDSSRLAARVMGVPE